MEPSQSYEHEDVQSSDLACIVIDIGSFNTKFGTSQYTVPSLVTRTAVGKYSQYVNPESSDEVFYGDDAIQHTGLSISNPMDHGHVLNWDEIHHLVEFCFTQTGMEMFPQAYCFSIPVHSSMAHRERLAELVFETFEGSELTLPPSGVLATYGTGRTTGLSIDIGHGMTECVPMLDGHLLTAGTMRSDIGGEELTMYLQRILNDMEYPLTTRKEIEIVRDIKETHIYCSLNPAEEQEREDLTETYYLPDDQPLCNGAKMIEIGSERIFPPEILFNPYIFERECTNICDLVVESLKNCPIHTRKTLYETIILSGGTSKIPNLVTRLANQLQSALPYNLENDIKIDLPDNPANLCWTGGMVIGGPTMRTNMPSLWISNEDYFEEGIRVVRKNIWQ